MADISTPKPKLNWFQRWHRRRQERWFEALYADPTSFAHAMVLAKANPMAQGMVARWMDDRGYLRCAACLTTTELRKVGKSYFCRAHREEIEKQKGQGGGK